MVPTDLGHVDVGTDLPVQVTFTNKAGVPTDPTTVTGKTLAPGASVPVTYLYGTDAAISRISAGVYEFDIDVTLADVWRAGMQGTGAVKASVDFTFTADPSPLGWT